MDVTGQPARARSDIHLSTLPTLGAGAVVGGGIAVLGSIAMSLIRSRSISLGAVERAGAWGVGIGLVQAGAALLVDRATSGGLSDALDSAWSKRHQGAFVLRHPTMPWLYSSAMRASSEARDWEHREWGAGGHVDNGADAFRHALGSALFALELERHGVDAKRAVALVEEAGRAHEADGDIEDGPRRDLSNGMDLHNNGVGARLAGDGRGPDGSWLTQEQLAQRVMDALVGGQLVRVDRRQGTLVPTGPSDLAGARLD